jgi:hypothetical protein
VILIITIIRWNDQSPRATLQAKSVNGDRTCSTVIEERRVTSACTSGRIKGKAQ